MQGAPHAEARHPARVVDMALATVLNACNMSDQPQRALELAERLFRDGFRPRSGLGLDPNSSPNPSPSPNPNPIPNQATSRSRRRTTTSCPRRSGSTRRRSGGSWCSSRGRVKLG